MGEGERFESADCRLRQGTDARHAEMGERLRILIIKIYLNYLFLISHLTSQLESAKYQEDLALVKPIPFLPHRSSNRIGGMKGIE